MTTGLGPAAVPSPVEVTVALHVVPLGGPAPAGLRLRDGAVAVPALVSQVLPALVLGERETREVLAAARAQDVALDGPFSAGPAGVQLWDGPFNGPKGTHGAALQLGSVDWNYDAPAKHYATIYRVIVTQAGIDAGQTTASIMATVLALAGLTVDGNRISPAVPPARDPFRRLAAVGA